MKKRLISLSLLLVPAGSGLAATGEVESQAEAASGSQVVQAPALDSSHLIDTIIGLILVLALVLALAWVVKRYTSMPGMGEGKVQVLGGTSLGPRERAVLVSVEGQRLLLGVAQGSVQTLYVLDENAHGGEGSRQQDDFAKELQKASQEDAS